MRAITIENTEDLTLFMLEAMDSVQQGTLSPDKGLALAQMANAVRPMLMGPYVAVELPALPKPKPKPPSDDKPRD